MWAFALLAICVLALAALVFVQSLPRRLPWPVALVVSSVVALLAIVVLVITSGP